MKTSLYLRGSFTFAGFLSLQLEAIAVRSERTPSGNEKFRWPRNALSTPRKGTQSRQPEKPLGGEGVAQSPLHLTLSLPLSTHCPSRRPERRKKRHNPQHGPCGAFALRNDRQALSLWDVGAGGTVARRNRSQSGCPLGRAWSFQSTRASRVPPRGPGLSPGAEPGRGRGGRASWDPVSWSHRGTRARLLPASRARRTGRGEAPGPVWAKRGFCHPGPRCAELYFFS